MKGTTLALDRLDGRACAALMVDGQLDELWVDPPAGVVAPGTVFRGRLGRPVKGMGGAFVELPGGASGFLRQPRGLRPGATLLVQVSGPAEGGKALPVTARLLLKGGCAIITVGAPGVNISRQLADAAQRAQLQALADHAMKGADPALGLILRSSCAAADADRIAADIARMRAQAEQLLAGADGAPARLMDPPDAHAQARREVPEPDSLDDTPGSFARHGVDDALAALRRPRVALAQGAAMMIEPTAALVAVDVDTGPDTSPAAGLKASIAAARALPRELRLRGLGGQVVIDFAPYPKRGRAALEQALRAAVRRDGRDITLAGWTPLGQFELTRKRDRPTLETLLP